MQFLRAALAFLRHRWQRAGAHCDPSASANFCHPITSSSSAHEAAWSTGMSAVEGVSASGLHLKF
jgi:hypothetical protein